LGAKIPPGSGFTELKNLQVEFKAVKIPPIRVIVNNIGADIFDVHP
jgi:hypothetical protein